MHNLIERYWAFKSKSQDQKRTFCNPGWLQLAVISSLRLTTSEFSCSVWSASPSWSKKVCLRRKSLGTSGRSAMLVLIIFFSSAKWTQGRSQDKRKQKNLGDDKRGNIIAGNTISKGEILGCGKFQLVILWRLVKNWPGIILKSRLAGKCHYWCQIMSISSNQQGINACTDHQFKSPSNRNFVVTKLFFYWMDCWANSWRWKLKFKSHPFCPPKKA